MEPKHSAHGRAAAHASHPHLPRGWSDGDVRIQIDNVEHDVARNALSVDLRAFREGTRLVLDTPYLYVNPPLGIRVGDSVVVNVPQAFREMVTRTVRAQSGG